MRHIDHLRLYRHAWYIMWSCAQLINMHGIQYETAQLYRHKVLKVHRHQGTQHCTVIHLTVVFRYTIWEQVALYSGIPCGAHLCNPLYIRVYHME